MIGAGFVPRYRPYVNRTHCAAYRASRNRIAMMWTIGVSPPSLGYFLRAPPRSRAPSGGHRGGRRLEPIEVPQDGLDEADEGRPDAAVGLDGTHRRASTVIPPGYSSRR